jgi:predicted DNA-binding protein (UPF0251 family)
MSRKHKKKNQDLVVKIDKFDAITRAQGQQERTAKNKERLLEALRIKDTITEACESVGIHRDTYYNYLNDPDFAESVKLIENSWVDLSQGLLLTVIKSTEEKTSDRVAAAKVILAAKGKSFGYGTENRKLEHSGEINTNARVEITARLPDNGRGPIPSGDTPAISI